MRDMTIIIQNHSFVLSPSAQLLPPAQGKLLYGIDPSEGAVSIFRAAPRTGSLPFSVRLAGDEEVG